MAREFRIGPGTDELAEACFSVEPGDTIRLLAGRHHKPATLTRSGRAGRPIRIVADRDAVIDGRQTGHPDILPELSNGNLVYPRWQDWAFLKLDGASWVELVDLTVKGCWPCFLHARQVSHLVVRDCVIEEGTYPLFFRDLPDAVTLSSDILVEGCRWRQDMSDDHYNWAGADWRDLHGERSGGVLHKALRHYNGAFVGTCDIGGRMVLRGNRIEDSFNGFRLGLSRDVRAMGDAAIRRRNRDVEISNNCFTRVRDNPVEPENHAHNWIVRHNTMVDCHTWFSMDAVAGGYWYIYGNLGRFTSRQGGPKSNMGKVMKLSSADSEPMPDAPVYVFNNSWYLRCPVLAGDPPPDDYRIRGLNFRNNAIQYCAPQQVPVPGQKPPVCEAGVRYIANLRWTPALGTIDDTICNHGAFPASLREHGHEANGIAATRRIFTDAACGDLTLDAGSEGRGAGVALELVLPDGRRIRIHPADRGAWQGAALVAVPELEAMALV